MKRSPTLVALAFSVLTLISGCASRSSASQPAASPLVLGKTTYAEVVARYGPPKSEEARVQNGHPIKTLIYAESGGAGARLTFFNFSNLILVGHNVRRGASETDLDDTKVAGIKEGETTERQVLGLLGEPSGRFIYPLTYRKGETGFGYIDRRAHKSLRIIFSTDGVVKRVELQMAPVSRRREIGDRLTSWVDA
jgi:hypothetical protein